MTEMYITTVISNAKLKLLLMVKIIFIPHLSINLEIRPARIFVGN